MVQTLATNYYGTLATCEAFLPLIRDGGRIANVSSMASKLGKYSSELQKRFREGKTVEDFTTLMEEFKRAVKENEHTKLGWPSAAYAVSKAGVTGLTKAFAIQAEESGRKVLVNACCPGASQDSQSERVRQLVMLWSAANTLRFSRRLCKHRYVQGQRNSNARSRCTNSGAHRSA